jgi:DNA-binding NtrC family response regulator
MLPASSPESIGVAPNAVLLVSDSTEDHAVLPNIFHGTRWSLQRAWTARKGLEAIRRYPREIVAVICQQRLADGDWKLMLGEMRNAGVRASLIVASRLADECMWAKVLNLGGFDLLLRAPFERNEVLRVTESAWSAWSREARRSGAPPDYTHTAAMHVAAGRYL